MMTAPRPSTGRARDPARLRLLGESMAMRALRKAVARVAVVNSSVLITGETGTGKELVAHQLHQRSDRAAGPFVAVNCAALPPGLFQAEVFGYEKGAFTGAYQRHAGHIEVARGGTLLLDEIGDLALETQVILLRFLEEGIFERLGSTSPIRADVRILASTHSDLEAACREGRFREDLFYRLNSLRIRTPPLRERGTDIELMARHFLAEFTKELRLRRHRFAPEALELMGKYSWPGNVRELRNRIRQALVLSEHETLQASDLGLSSDDVKASGEESARVPSLRRCREAAEREAITRALKLTANRIPDAAALLGISRSQLYRLIERHRIQLHSD